MIRSLSIAVCLTMAACVGTGAPLGDTVIQSNISPNYEPPSVSVFAGGGGVSTILGTTRDGASAAEIAANIRLPASVSPRNVTASPEALTGPHMVLVFAPVAGTTPRKACSGRAEGGQAGAELKVLGVFCSSFGTPVSEALFVAAGSPVPSDPDFGQRLGALMNAIMPVRNPDFGLGCRAANC